MRSTPSRALPGLTKIRSVPFVQRRSVELCAALDGRWRGVIEAADVVSEGSTRAEPGGLVYYGSTSVLLARVSAGGQLPDDQIAGFLEVVRSDPHTRARALRIAHREATRRAGGEIGTLHADLGVRAEARGVLLLVEVMAQLLASRAAGEHR